MAPFRASRSSRFGRPGLQGDVDIIDGLPVRQWRLQEAVIGNAASYEDPNDPANRQAGAAVGPGGWPELPMPKGSNLYAPWCQNLLRAARAGRVMKRKEPDTAEDDKENEHEDEHGPAEPSKNGFVAQRWAPVPRRLEEPEPEYLAKRRKGLPSAHGSSNQVNGSGRETLTVDGVPSSDEPIRRRAPPPRRKPKKGPGRKRKLVAGEGINPLGAAGDSSAAQTGDGATEDGDHSLPPASEGGAEQDEDDEEDDDDDEEAEEAEDGEVEEHSGDDREEGEIKDEEPDVSIPGPDLKPDNKASEPASDAHFGPEIMIEKPPIEPLADSPPLRGDPLDAAIDDTAPLLPGLDLHNAGKISVSPISTPERPGS